MMTETQKVIFLETLLETGLEARSARTAGLALRQVQKEYEADRGFYEDAMDRIEEFNDSIEAEAIRRARDGVDEPVFYKGAQVTTKRVYSDALMNTLLKGRRPVYNKQEISGTLNVPVQVVVRAFGAADPHALDHSSKAIIHQEDELIL